MHCSKRVSFWGTSYSRPPIDPYLTSPLLQNPGGTTASEHEPGPKNPFFLCPNGRVATGEGRLVQWGRTKFSHCRCLAMCHSLVTANDTLPGNDILLNQDNDSFCTVSWSTCKLGGSWRPQCSTVNCLSEESDIASYFVDISLMFASLIRLKIIIFLCTNGKSKLV